jgi:PIN domain nuclease of toxin-antitoxin system
MIVYALDTNIVSYFLHDNEVVMKAISNLIESRHSITLLSTTKLGGG